MRKTFRNTFFIVGLMLVSAMIAFAASSVNSPSACSGQWTTCSNANANDASRATFTATNTANGSGVWNNYGFSIPNSASIGSVIVRADFFASNVRGFIKVKLSGDGGATYGPEHIVGGNTAEQTFLIDATSDLAWTGSKLNNSNLRVNVTCFKSPQSSTNPTCRLDWVPVNVTYTPFDFSLSSSPSSASVAQANNATTTVTATLLSGTSQSVSLSVVNCPTGALCTFNQSSGNPTYAAQLTVATSSSTPAGTYVINVSGIGNGLTRITTFTLNVTDSLPTASALANPISGNAPLLVNFTGSVLNGNAPFTYFWNFTDGGTSTDQNPQYTFNTAGTYFPKFTVTDFDGDTSIATVNVTVNATSTGFDFSMSRSPASGTVEAGGSVQTTITATLLNGTSQNVNLEAVNCPFGVSCMFNQSSGNPTYAAVLTISANSSATPGFYNLNISGTGGGLTRSAFYNLNVCLRGNPLVKISPDSQLGAAGNTLVYNVNVSNTDSIACGSSVFELTKSVPLGWSGVFGNGANASGAKNITLFNGAFSLTNLSVTSDVNATPGNYTFSNTATNLNSPSHSASDSADYEVI